MSTPKADIAATLSEPLLLRGHLNIVQVLRENGANIKKDEREDEDEVDEEGEAS